MMMKKAIKQRKVKGIYRDCCSNCLTVGEEIQQVVKGQIGKIFDYDSADEVYNILTEELYR